MTNLAPTRAALHRVAVHVLARTRTEASGRFSLRVTTGGIGTPDLPDGRPSTLLVERQGAEVRLSIVPDLWDPGDDEGLDAPRWNATFQAIHRDRVPDLAFHRAAGVYVLGVKYPGNAASSGLREHDVVLAVDRRPVKDLAGLRALYEASLRDGRPKKAALLEVLRDGSRLYVGLDFEREAGKDD